MRLRRTVATFAVLMMVLAAIPAFPAPVFAENEDPDAEGKIFGPWNISVAKTFVNTTIEVTGNVTIMNGGHLTLDNVTLIINSSSTEEYYLTVENHGHLDLVNGSVITNNATQDRPFHMVVEWGGRADISGSTLRGMGDPDVGVNFTLASIKRLGLLVQSTAVTIKDSVVEESHIGCACTGLLPVTPTFQNVTFRNNTVGMGLSVGCNPVMGGNTYADNDIGLWVIAKSITTTVVDGDVFQGNGGSIGGLYADLTLSNLLVSGSTDGGIIGMAGSVIHADNISLTGSHNATWLDNSTLELIDSDVSGTTNLDFFLFNGSSADAINTTIETKDKVDVVDQASLFRLMWYLDVKVEHENGTGVIGALVNMTDVLGQDTFRTATDTTGWIATEMVAEAIDAGLGMVGLTPHNLTAEKEAYWNESVVTMDRSQSLVLTVFERDLVPPVIDISHPANGTHIAVPALTVSGTAADASGVDLVQVRVDGGAWEDATGTEDWSHDLVLPADGIYSICVRAMDPTGNAAEECVEVTLDRVAPSLTVTEPVDGSYYNHSQLFVKGTTDGDLLTVNGEGVPVFNDTFSHPFTLEVEGANEIVVVASDLAGNNNTTTLTIHRDLAPPDIEMTAPLPDDVVNSTTVDFVGNVTDGQGVDKVLVSTDGTVWNEAVITFEGAGRTDGTFEAFLTLAEGEWAMQVKAIDLAGNQRLLAFNITVKPPDVTPPEVDIVTPVDGDRMSILTITVTGTASDDEGVASVEVGLDGTNWTEAATDDDWATWSVPITLARGSNEIRARATDLAGNTATDIIDVEAMPPEVDDIEPTVTVTRPANNKVFHKKAVRFEGTASDNVGVKAVYVSPSGGGAGATWVLAEYDEASGTWTADITLLFNGWNTIGIRAEDEAGNENVTIMTIKYEKVAEGGGLDMTMLLILFAVLIVLVVVYVATLPGRRRARRAMGEEEEDEDMEDEEDEEGGGGEGEEE